MKAIFKEAAIAPFLACLTALFVKNGAKITHLWCDRGTIRAMRTRVRRELLLVQELTVRKGTVEGNTVPEICDNFDKFAARML